MRQYIQPWVEYETIHKGRQPGGVDRYRRTVELFINWAKGNGISEDPSEITRDDINNFMKWLFYEKQNIKNSSRANKLASIRSFFHYLVNTGVIKEDATKGIPTPKLVKKMPKKFTKEELGYIFAMPDLKTESGIRDLAILKTLYGAGLRVSEACHLKMDNITDGGGYIRLNIVGKGSKNRVVPLRNNPSKTLRHWYTIRLSHEANIEDPVFVRLKGGNHEGLSTVTMNNILKKYAVKAKIKTPDVFIHKLRSTYASDLFDNGFETLEIMVLMGHSDPKTTMQYIVISEKRLKKVAIPDSYWKELEQYRNRLPDQTLEGSSNENV